jgi:NTE family protein
MASKRKPVGQACAIPKHDHSVLVLQGGGALGAYQAGVYEGMAEKGFALSDALARSLNREVAGAMAKYPASRRIERLREFWDQVSSGLPSSPVLSTRCD